MGPYQRGHAHICLMNSTNSNVGVITFQTTARQLYSHCLMSHPVRLEYRGKTIGNVSPPDAALLIYFVDVFIRLLKDTQESSLLTG